MRVQFRLAVPVVALLLFTAVMQAGPALTPLFVTTAPSGLNPGATTFIYELLLSDGARLDVARNENPNNPATPNNWAHMFTIFDFAGFIPGSESTSNPDFVFTGGANLGPYTDAGAPNPVLGDDSGSVPNIAWNWVGAADVIAPAGGISLGFFSADSIFSGLAMDVYVGQDTKHNPAVPTEHRTQGLNEGNVTVPNFIPEPGTYLLLGSSLAALGMLRKRLARM